jgi:hypothetical protein
VQVQVLSSAVSKNKASGVFQEAFYLVKIGVFMCFSTQKTSGFRFKKTRFNAVLQQISTVAFTFGIYENCGGG